MMRLYDRYAESDERGFTLLELLVATSLTSIIMAMVIGAMMINRQAYYEDVVRTKINSNIRSSLDIISMNVRQAGENLQDSFPAILLEDGVTATSDRLTLRRNLLPEVMTLCLNATAGFTNLTISSLSLSDPECITTNVQNSYDAFQQMRTSEGGSTRIYIYDQISKQGEFLDYVGEFVSGGVHVITTSPVTIDYDAMTTSLYMIEEYQFELSATDNTLELYEDGDTSTPRSVAFEISGLSVEIEMQDGSVVTVLDSSSSYTWKDIRQVLLTLDGEDTYRKRTITSSLTSGYFPRNVLSY